MKEFELIGHIRKEFAGNNKRRDLLVPIGDDCSILRPPKGLLQVTTVDSLVEGNHFSLKYFSPAEIGRKALRVNLSDLASMGAIGPYYAWLTLAISSDVDEKTIKGILAGIKEDCGRFDVVLAGGNITSSAQFQIHVTLSGWVKPGLALTRTGAKAGDIIFVTGSIGASTLAYRQFKEGKEPDKQLLKRWANPVPKISIGQFLSKKKIASSCIDISDGIFQDMQHITGQSGVGAELRWKDIPIFPYLKKLHPTPHMVGFGEDYELLFTVPPKKQKLLSPIRDQIAEIGTVTKKGFTVRKNDGNPMDIDEVGYRHIT